MDWEKLDIKTWMSMNAKLQGKKNALRKALKEKGVQRKGAKNDFDHYSYFSEAQYKELFTELFAEFGLELKFTELEYCMFDGSEKQANGRTVRLEFDLIDVETGFFEASIITGEALDKGDKAGYKAYTGALKYYLADTFMVATGDDPEKDSPEARMTKGGRPVARASAKQLSYIQSLVPAQNMAAMMDYYHIDKITDLTAAQASEIIDKKMKARKAADEEMAELPPEIIDT